MKKVATQLALASLMLGVELQANPTGPSVISGDVTINSFHSDHLTVESRSERAIISWDSFSIDTKETTYFQLPNTSSAVLNRVQSNLPSTLSGILESNGHVYLINPNGILVTKEGIINTASFLASTLDVNNFNFLNDADLLFAGASQEAIINRGQITAWNGDLVLVGYSVRNEGTLNAPAGTTALAVGQEIYLTPKADQKITVRIPVKTEEGKGVGIVHEGVIKAIDAELKADGNPYAMAIQSSGWIQANGSKKNSGRIFLVATDGILSQTGTLQAAGGEVQLLGKSVAVEKYAEVNVSAANGGGKILIGGGLKGEDPEVQNADYVFVGSSARLNADALNEGDGGLIVVWGNKTNLYYGSASARGGDGSGNGGFIEVSSPAGLTFCGFADRDAPNGQPGTLLLDPYNVQISNNGGVDINETFAMNTYTPTGSPAIIDVDNLFAALNMGPVTIITTGAGGDDGDISIFSWTASMMANNWNSTNLLTLTADRNIIIDGGVASFNNGTGPAFGSIAMSAGTTTSGVINMQSSTTITMQGTGALSMSADNPGGVAISLLSDIDYNASGDCTLTAVNGGIVINPSFVNFGTIASSGSLTIIGNDPSGTFVSLSGIWTFGGMGGMGENLSVTTTGGIFWGNGSLLDYSYSGTLTFSTTANMSYISFSDLIVNPGAGGMTVAADGGAFFYSNLAVGLDYSSTDPASFTANNGNLGFDRVVFNPGSGGLTASAQTDISFGGLVPFTYNSTTTCSLTSAASGITFNTGADFTSVSGGLTATAFQQINMFNASFDYASATDCHLTSTHGSMFFQGSVPVNITGAGDLIIRVGVTGMTTGFFEADWVLTFGMGAGGLDLEAYGGINLNGISYSSATNALIVCDTGTINLNGAMTFASGAGGLTVTSFQGINLNNVLDYTSAQDAIFTVTNGSYYSSNSSATNFHSGSGNLTIQTSMMTGQQIWIDGPITFDAGAGGLTLSANGELNIQNALTYNSSNPMVWETFAGDIAVDPVTVALNTTALFTIDSAANFQSLGQIRNSAFPMGGAIHVTTGNDCIIESANGIPSILGSKGGDLVFNIGRDLGVVATVLNPLNDAYAQIGYDSGDITSNIAIQTAGGSVSVISGIAGNCYAVIGHGSAMMGSGGGTRTGNISIGASMAPIGGSVSVNATSTAPIFSGTNSFTQIGHLPGEGVTPVTVTNANISIYTTGSILVKGGDVMGKRSMIGHGGVGTTADSFSGNIIVHTAGPATTVGVVSGSEDESFASIGHAYVNNSATNNVTLKADLVEVIAVQDVFVFSDNNSEAIIGGYIKSPMGGTGTFTSIGAMGTPLISIEATGGSVTVSGVSPSNQFNAVLIGALAYDGTVPPVAAGSAKSNLVVTAGTDLIISTGSSGMSTDAFALLTNGNGGPTGTFNIDLTGIGNNLQIFGGNNFAAIQSLDTLSIITGGDIFLLSNQLGGSLGTASIESHGTTTITATGDISIIGYESGPTSFLTNSTGAFTVDAGIDLALLNNDATGITLTGGTGLLTVSSGDNMLILGSTISNMGTGDYSINCSGNATLAAAANAIITGTNLGSVTVGQNLFILADDTSFAEIKAGAGLTVSSTGGNIYLVGFLDPMTPQSASINSDNGPLIVFADKNIGLFDNSDFSITNAMTATADLSFGTAQGGVILSNGCTIENFGTGDINTTSMMPMFTGVAGDTLIRGYPNASFISADSGAINLTMGGGLDLVQDATINSNPGMMGASFITSASKIRLDGNSAATLIRALTGDLTLSATGYELSHGATVTAAAGDLDVTSTSDDILVYDGGLFHGETVTVTAFNDLALAGGPSGTASITAITDMALDVAGEIALKSSSTNAATISGSGTMDIGVGTTPSRLALMGSGAIAASITDATGTLTINADSVYMVDTATITLSAGAGTLEVSTLDGNLVLIDNAGIFHNGTGSIDLSGLSDDLYLRGGSIGKAQIFGANANPITIEAGNIYMSADTAGNNAWIRSASGGPVSVTATGLLSMDNHSQIDVPSAMSSNSLVITVDALKILNESLLSNLGTGSTLVTVNGDAELKGINGISDTGIRGSAGSTSVIVTGDLTIESGFGSQTGIFAPATLIVAGDGMGIMGISNIRMVGVLGGAIAQISSGNGPLTVVVEDQLEMADNSQITVSALGNPLAVTTHDGSIFLVNGSIIQHAGIGAVNLLSGEDITVAYGSSVEIASGANTLTVGTGGGLTITENSQILQNGTGNIALTVSGDFLAKAGATGSAGVNSVGGSVDLDVTGMVQLASGQFGKGSVAAATGVNVHHSASGVGSILMTGISSLQFSTITTAVGALNVASAGPIDLLSFSTISLTDVMMGTTYTLTAHSDLLVSNDSTLFSNGTGTMAVTVDGSATLLAGAGDAILLSDSPTTNISVNGNLYILSDQTGSAGIETGGVLNTTVGGGLYMVGYPNGMMTNNSTISSNGNAVTVTSVKDLILLDGSSIQARSGTGMAPLNVVATNGNLVVDNSSSIEHQDLGGVTINVGANALVRGGPAGGSFIASDASTLSVNVTGALDVEASAGGEGFLMGNGTTNIEAAKLTITGVAGMIPVNAYITNDTGSLTVNAGRIDMDDFALIQLTGGAGVLQVNSTAGDLSLFNGSTIENTGSGVTVCTSTATLYLDGGPDAPSAINGGTNETTVTVNSLLLKSTMSGNVISATSGDLNITTTRTASLVSFSGIELGTMTGSGDLNFSIGTDLLIANESHVRNIGLGTTTVGAGGVLTLLAGAGNASIESMGALTAVSGNNFRVIADLDGDAFINGGGVISITSGADLFVTGSPESMTIGDISTLSGNLTVLAANNITLLDQARIALLGGSGILDVTTTNFDLNIINGSQISHTSSDVGINIKGNVLIKSGGAGASFIESNGVLNLKATETLSLEATVEAEAMIVSQGTTLITAAHILLSGYSAMSDAEITNTTGDLTLTAQIIDLQNHALVQLTGGAGNLNLNATNGNLNLANSASVIQSGTGALNGTISRALNVLGGDEGASVISGGIGGTTLTAYSAYLSGPSSLNGANITDTMGPLTLTTTTTTLLDAFATIGIIGGTSDLNLVVKSDLIVNNGSTISHTGSGNLIANITGFATINGGLGDSSLSLPTGAINVTTGDNLRLIGDGSGDAFITTAGNISITSGGDLFLAGSTDTAHAAYVASTGSGTVTVIADNDIIVRDLGSISNASGANPVLLTTKGGDLRVVNGSSITTGGTGAITATIAGNVLVRSGSLGDGAILSAGPLTIAPPTTGSPGNVTLESLNGNNALITGAGTTTVTADKLLMFGSSTALTEISTTGGSLNVTTNSATLLNHAEIRLEASALGTMTIKTLTGDMRISNHSSVQNFGSGTMDAIINRTLYVEGGPLGASTLKGNGVNTTVTAYSILIDGIMDSVGSIEAVKNNLTINTTKTLDMTPFSHILLTGPGVTGTIFLNIGTDLIRSSNTAIINSVTGMVTFNVSGSQIFCM
jgi:filamentous hemagglutinin family protein